VTLCKLCASVGVCGCLQTPITYWVAVQAWGKSQMWVVSFIQSHFNYKLQTNTAALNQCHDISIHTRTHARAHTPTHTCLKILKKYKLDVSKYYFYQCSTVYVPTLHTSSNFIINLFHWPRNNGKPNRFNRKISLLTAFSVGDETLNLILYI
jgi:hypothetical protein